MTPGLAAALWGLLGGSALVLGAVFAWKVKVAPAVVAGVMAFALEARVSSSVGRLRSG